MMHPHTTVAVVDPHIGYGVFATSLIPAGTLVYVRDELEIVLPPDDPRVTDPVLGPVIETYSYLDPAGCRVMSWDIAKYVNHSCEPNTVSTGWGFEIALRDIQPGEQVTDDYALFNLTWSLACQCGEAGCRSIVSSDAFIALAMRYDRRLRPLLRKVQDVSQPLWPFLDESSQRELKAYTRTRRGYRSVTQLLCASVDRIAS